jgi:hypothetical protein
VAESPVEPLEARAAEIEHRLALLARKRELEARLRPAQPEPEPEAPRPNRAGRRARVKVPKTPAHARRQKVRHFPVRADLSELPVRFTERHRIRRCSCGWQTIGTDEADLKDKLTEHVRSA